MYLSRLHVCNVLRSNKGHDGGGDLEQELRGDGGKVER
jgi:hypothetical protein